MKILTTLGIGAVTLAAATAHAQSGSGLGFNLAELSAGYAEQDRDGADGIWSLEGRADFAVTHHHGVQFDLSYTGYEAGDLGHLGSHVYMIPTEGQKYGIFGSFGDFNDHDGTVVTFGFEGMFQLGRDMVAEARLGLGNIAPGSTDYIFAGGSLDYAVSDTLSIAGTLNVANFDEVAFRGTTYAAGIEATYAFGAAPVSLTADLTALGAEGRDDVDTELQAGLRVNVRFGGPATTRKPVRDRLFRRHDAADTFLRLGLN